MSLTTDKIIAVRWCLKAMGVKEIGTSSALEIPLVLVKEGSCEKIVEYNPYENGRQCIDLIERFKLSVRWIEGKWCVQPNGFATVIVYSAEGKVHEAIVHVVGELYRRTNPEAAQAQTAFTPRPNAHTWSRV